MMGSGFFMFFGEVTIYAVMPRLSKEKSVLLLSKSNNTQYLSKETTAARLSK